MPAFLSNLHEVAQRVFVRGAQLPDPALPVRVRAVIMMHDRDSERLIGSIQVGIALLLAAFYFAAPHPEDAARAAFAPVPVAIAVFLAVSVLRLWRIVVRPLPGRLVALSIVCDVGLLLALIWSFHLQYGQPPGFSLKAPAFVYLFVFIVLRTLRYDPRYVLAAGLAAASGWAVLTALTIWSAGRGAVTRSYTAYIGGSEILVGAEVDKILILLIVTAILTFGARHAQRTLVEAVREAQAVKEIRRFLSKGVAEQIAGAETLIEAGHAEERNAAILMIDIRGFTAFAMTVEPREVVRILTGFHARLIPIVRKHGGIIDKFLGDGVMVTFGAAMPSANAAADALGALEDVLETARIWEESLPVQGLTVPLHVNAAVAAGPVVFATLGDGDRLEYTVIGEAVNLAAKLEKHNKQEGSRAVVAADAFKRAVGEGFVARSLFSPRPGARVAGVSVPLDIVASFMPGR